MTKKELIMSTLEKMGYTPEIDDDGDIKVLFQMKTIYAMTGDDEEPYISMLLPQFHEVEDGEEALAVAVCNKMTREYKMMKVFIDQTFKNVSASCEFYYASDEDLELNISKALHMLGIVRSAFREELSELAEE